MPSLSYVINECLPHGLRLDRFVSEYLRLLSRSQIKARNLSAKINGKEAKLSRPVKQGNLLELLWDDSPVQDIVPQNIPLDIIYEDERCVVVNKPQGLVVHPGAGNRQGTLANALCYVKMQRGTEAGAGARPGIVHRLDKETSGVIIAAWDEEAQAFLCEQFKSRKVKKTYAAIVRGVPKEKNGRIETFIARDPKNRKRFTVSERGKTALTFYKVVKSWQNYSLLLLRPRTGRTHQLRVHLKFLGHPILGDPLYGSADKHFPDAALMLHSRDLAITLIGEKEERVFSSPIPDRFHAVMEKLDTSGGAHG
jgi:23S rRNA pseudouridine1911/1915/1917 synthase